MKARGMSRSFCLIIVVLSIFFIPSCQMPSKVAMEGEGGRISYNVAIQNTNAQQMLLNLVRLRYADNMMFLDVSSITTQSTIRSQLSPLFSIPGFNDQNPFRLGADVSWQDQPTITYAPLEGQSFATRLLRPIDLRTVQLLCYSGWDIDRVFWMIIQNFHELWNDPESSPDKEYGYQCFFEVSQLLRTLQKRGELQLGVQMKSCVEEGKDLEEESLQIGFPLDNPEGVRLSEILHCDQTVNGRCIKNISLGYTDLGRIGVMPRSVYSCMSYLSRGVDVPTEHLNSGKVRHSENMDSDSEGWTQLFRNLIKVCWSRLAPKNAFVCVKYRDYWFYIDDSDLKSKKTFSILMQLYNLSAHEAKNRGPILTLPLG